MQLVRGNTYESQTEAAEVKAMSKRALAQELERVGRPTVATRASPRFQGVKVAVNIHCSP